MGNYAFKAALAAQQTISPSIPLVHLLVACFIFKQTENCQIYISIYLAHCPWKTKI